MTEVLRGSDQFGDRGAGLGCVARQHMTESVRAESIQICGGEGLVDDLAHRFSTFPGAAREGVRKMLRDVFGKTRHDSTFREELAASLRSIEQRENERRGMLERQIKLESKRHNERMDGLRAKTGASIERRKQQLREQARADRAATPTTAPFVDRSTTAKADFKQANENSPQRPNKARTGAKPDSGVRNAEKTTRALSARKFTPF